MIELTGGDFCGLSIQAPAGKETRPTASRVRQALFNSIQSHIIESTVLDLFAGAGTLGFEALSRGAKSVVFYENSGAVRRLIRSNAQKLGVQKKIIVQSSGNVDKIFKNIPGEAPFDLVLIDPPYGLGWEKRMVEHLDWNSILAPSGLVFIERTAQHCKKIELPDKTRYLNLLREKKYGDTMLTTYVKSEVNESNLPGDL